MRTTKYTFDGLRRLTQDIRRQSAKIVDEQRSLIDKAFIDFDNYFAEVEKQPPTLERNVRMMLACQFFNHLYSAIILAESGLIVDAFLFERNALETIAFHWLICLDSSVAEEYEQNSIPRPVKVRERLEQLGADITHIKGLYSSGSEISHVGRNSERFHSQWESRTTGELLFGGGLNLNDQHKMLQFLPVLLYLFPEPIMKDAS